ncbi:hypothetical protein J8273_8413 [Carpediemonas membranifera]|uniref:Uncharacterized protein n=1 Tax=Carpediemonas membranifera TaxID=201153 RepID=A0A8J6DXA2_9EUKA|nr:hypothetical protein J8273_8413 [Carpediemonas membranifera]|eukprot:KAG9389739.1 hypothetical protein J8273_8413 [Carpediemonas membranifera]
MSSAISSPSSVRDALISAFRASLVVTASIPGSIPSLIQSPLKPAAQALLDRAHSILTIGPPLSMNVELSPGEELPVAMHTLNQGAVWACLVGGGANPDLEDRVLGKAQEARPRGTELHNKIRKILTPEAKCFWFLCRKFFFTVNIAEKDGESYHYAGYDTCYHHRMYMGRLFMLHTDKHTALTRARMPRALEVYSDNYGAHIARTPKGMWRWGYSGLGQLGFQSSDFVDPTRLTFPACPKVPKLEASLPPWEKHGIVTEASIQGKQTFILTPVGTVMAGDKACLFTGPVQQDKRLLFHPVAVPAGFVPDHILHDNWTSVILSMGDRQMIGGSNECGRLGLGHENEITGFVDLPYRVDRIMPSQAGYCNAFLHGRQLLFVGLVPLHIAQSGLLPGNREEERCLTPTPLRFSERVKRFFCSEVVVWVTEGRTHLCNRYTQFCVPLRPRFWAYEFRASEKSSHSATPPTSGLR